MNCCNIQKPEWKQDDLSQALRDGEHNVLVSSHNYKDIYDTLSKAYQIIQNSQNVFINVKPHDLIFSSILFIRARASLLASIRLILAGQPIEAQPLLRLMIEQLWYGFYIAIDPKPPTRQKIWLDRNDSKEAKKKCKREFTIKNVRNCHEQHDPVSADQLAKFYDSTIDYGAHPNQYSAFSQIKQDINSASLKYEIGIYSFDIPVTMSSIRMTLGIVVGYLKILQIVFKDTFPEFVSENEIDELILNLNTQFQRWA